MRASSVGAGGDNDDPGGWGLPQGAAKLRERAASLMRLLALGVAESSSKLNSQTR
jgi:hypothetical protein